MSADRLDIKLEPPEYTDNVPTEDCVIPEFVAVKTEKEPITWEVRVKTEPINYTETPAQPDPFESKNNEELEKDIYEPEITLTTKSWDDADIKKLQGNQPKPNVKKTKLGKKDKAPKKEEFPCPICNKIFGFKPNLKNHILRHKEKNFKCDHCDKKFPTNCLLEAHSKLHSSARKYKCSQCEKAFKTNSNLHQHMRVHTKSFHCKVCNKSYAKEISLKNHEAKSWCSTNVMSCEVCNKVFKKKYLLDSHLKKHKDDRPYQCDMCMMAFKHKCALIRHIQIHRGDKPFPCKYCGKTFTHAGLIKPHLRKHTGEKPYECPTCQRLFTYKHNMERHFKVRHSKVKKLTCEICNKTFPRESRLKYHMRTHTSEKYFACYECPKKFSHKQNIVRHYSRKHPNSVYESVDTDASVALKLWDEVMNKKVRKLDKLPVKPVIKETCNEYILPDKINSPEEKNVKPKEELIIPVEVKK